MTPGLTLLESSTPIYRAATSRRGSRILRCSYTGCKELSVPPEECFGVTDAVSGIQAAEAGGMAALGLSRAHDEELLAAADPDVLVTSLDHVDLDALAEGRWLRGAPDRRRSRSTRGNSHGRPAHRRRPGGL